MPTRLIFKKQYVTPEEFIDALELHFKSLPADQLYLPVIEYTSCDKDKNETVVFNGKKNVVATNLRIPPDNRKYDKCFSMKTIKRDKSKAN